MSNANPFLERLREQFGGVDQRSAAIAALLPRLRDALTEASDALVETRAATAADPLTLRESLRPWVVRAMLRHVPLLFETITLDRDKAALLGRALEHELLLPPVPHRAGEPDPPPGPQTHHVDGLWDDWFAERVPARLGVPDPPDAAALRELSAAARRSGHGVVGHALFGDTRPSPAGPDASAPGPDAGEGADAGPADEAGATPPAGDARPAGDAWPPGAPGLDATFAPGGDAEAPAGDPRYAGMGRRLGAFLLDVFVLVFVVITPATILWLALDPDADTESWVGYLYVLIWPAYFASMHLALRATVGKALLGLEVHGDGRPSPSFRIRVLVRETLGRLVNQILWGAGYWLAIRHGFRQSWGDRLARTVVLRRAAPLPFLRASRAALGIAVALAVVTVSLGIASRRAERETAGLEARMDSLSARVGHLDVQIDTLFTRPVESLAEFQSDMSLASLCIEEQAEHFRSLRRIFATMESSAPLLLPSARRQYRVVERVLGTRLEALAARRRAADVILAETGEDLPAETMRYWRFLVSDADALDAEARRASERRTGS